MVTTVPMWRGLSVVLAFFLTIAFGRVGFAEVVNAPFGSTKVELDQGFVDALGSLGVMVEPTGSASLDAVADETSATTAIVASFPVQTGAVDTDPPGLDLLHAGGLKFSAGEISAEISDYVYNTNTGVLSGRAVSKSSDMVTAFTRAPLFKMDLSGVTLEAPSDLTSLGILRASGVVLTLTPEAANFLNSTFGIDSLAEGIVIGTADAAVAITQ